MNNERYNQIIDDAYKSYKKKVFRMLESWDAKYSEILKREADGCRPYSQDIFIKRIRTDAEFSEKWGLKIEERELTWKERSNLQTEDQRKGRVPDKNGRMQGEFGNLSPFTEKMIHYWCDQFNIPTKLIIVTYNNETVEVYE